MSESKYLTPSAVIDSSVNLMSPSSSPSCASKLRKPWLVTIRCGCVPPQIIVSGRLSPSKSAIGFMLRASTPGLLVVNFSDPYSPPMKSSSFTSPSCESSIESKSSTNSAFKMYAASVAVSPPSPLLTEPIPLSPPPPLIPIPSSRPIEPRISPISDTLRLLLRVV